MTVWLEVVGGPMDGMVCHGAAKPVKIGRASSSDLALTLDRHISGTHALVGEEKGSCWVEDPKSKNGTWVEGNEIPKATKVKLDPGSIFVVGKTAIELLRPDEAPGEITPADVQGRVKELLGNLTPTSLQAVEAAEREVRSRGLSCMDVRHLFIGLCGLEDRRLTRQLDEAGVEAETLCKTLRGYDLWAGGREWIAAIIEMFAGLEEADPEGAIGYSPRIATVLAEAKELANSQGTTEIDPLCLWYGILAEGRSIPATVLRGQGKDTRTLAERAKASLSDKAEPLLSRIGRDLTALARQGKFPPLVGRNDEMRKLIDILSNPSKNNALIVGKAGVGKGALAYGLAQETAKPGCAKEIRDKMVLEIPIDDLTQGSSSTKELENRLTELARAGRQSENTILFFDDIHLLLSSDKGKRGIGIQPSAFDAAFGDDDIWCVATMSEQEYEAGFKDDASLQRCFEVVSLAELDQETTTNILHYLKGVFEDRHGVRVADESVSLAVSLTAQYLTDRHLPAKAIQALEGACAAAGSRGDMDRSAAPHEPPEVGWEDVAGIVSEWTGLSAAELLRGETAPPLGGEEPKEAEPEGVGLEERLSRHGAWLIAREISDRISSLQCKYHLADVWDRRAALEELIRGELSRVAPERRGDVISYLRDLFPVAEGDPGLGKEIDRLREQLADSRDYSGTERDAAELAREIEEILLNSAKGEGGAAASGDVILSAVKELFEFSMGVEKITKAFLESLLAQGASETTRFDLPYWAKDLDRLIKEIVTQRSGESLTELKNYLLDLNSWLMASIAGYQQAAPEWCRDFRNRTSPRSIEQQAQLPDWKKRLGLASSELWDLYTEMIRDMHPDLVEDEVRDWAAKITKEQYEMLKRRSK